jgi:GNAT superfamily N-acetyltransferase
MAIAKIAKLAVETRLARSEDEMRQAWCLTQLAYDNFVTDGPDTNGFFVSKIPWARYQSMYRASSSEIADSPLHVCVAVLASGSAAGHVVGYSLFAEGSHCVFEKSDPSTHGLELRHVWRKAIEQSCPGERMCMLYQVPPLCSLRVVLNLAPGRQVAVDPAYSGLGVARQMLAFTHAAARGWGARFVIGATVDDSLLALRASDLSSPRAVALAKRGVRFAVNRASPVLLSRMGYVAQERDLVYSTWDSNSQIDPARGFLHHAWVV